MFGCSGGLLGSIDLGTEDVAPSLLLPYLYQPIVPHCCLCSYDHCHPLLYINTAHFLLDLHAHFSSGLWTQRKGLAEYRYRQPSHRHNDSVSTYFFGLEAQVAAGEQNCNHWYIRYRFLVSRSFYLRALVSTTRRPLFVEI